MLTFRYHVIPLALVLFCLTAYAQTDDNMILIPAGGFIMGEQTPAPDRLSQQTIYLPAFYIDQYEVTNSQYEEFILDDGYQNGDYWSKAGWQFIQTNKIDRPLGLERALYNAPNQPVVGVSWHEAQAFSKWAGKRLPTEAEWEKAARGADGRTYPWGNEMDWKRVGYHLANQRTWDVGSYPEGKSPYGVHDCASNVAEWVADTQNQTDSSRPLHVIRGGAWGAVRFEMQCTHRAFDKPEYRGLRIGFRCAQDAE